MPQQITTAPTSESENTEAAVEVCRHHWVIQPADGPVSNGSCQICGENRQFKNYVESATWGESRIASKNASTTVESTLMTRTTGARMENASLRTKRSEPRFNLDSEELQHRADISFRL